MSDYLKKRMEQILAGRPIPEKKKYTIPKVSKKRAEKIAQEKAELNGQDSFLVRWFKARMKEMSPVCEECGQKVETKIYQYAILSICHLLAKRETVCPSVALHPKNFITLCPPHHDKFDKSSWTEIEQWGAWPVIAERLIEVYPAIAENERRHFPEVLRKFIEENDGLDTPIE